MNDETDYGVTAVDFKTCGNCHWHRPLSLPEPVLASIKENNQPIPLVCGVNPPTVILAPTQANSLDPKSQISWQPQNVWPYPAQEEPACRLWREKV